MLINVRHEIERENGEVLDLEISATVSVTGRNAFGQDEYEIDDWTATDDDGRTYDDAEIGAAAIEKIAEKIFEAAYE